MIRHVFDTAGMWAGARFGLWVGAALAPLVWLVFFYDPTTVHLATAAATASDFELTTLPAVVVALLAAFGLGVIAGREHRRRTVRRLSRSVETLSGQLDEAEALVARVTGGTDEIIRAARGAHHRTEETPTDG